MILKTKKQDIEISFNQKITPNNVIKWEQVYYKYFELATKIEKCNLIEQRRMNKILVDNNAVAPEKAVEFFQSNPSGLIEKIFKEKIMVDRLLIFLKEADATKNKKATTTDLKSCYEEIKKGFDYNEDNPWYNCDLEELEETYNSFRLLVER
jgi:hypothetical protein